jgi:4-hydroxy-tetrahydrodipicolinate synthase
VTANALVRMIGGIIPVLPTPFTPQGEVDELSYSRVIDAAIEAGADALAMFGLASEYYKICDEERSRLTHVLIQHTARRVPVVISITAHATELAIRQAKAAALEGADALMLLPPYFLQPSVEAILEHIDAILDATPLPVILQYAPAQTAMPLDVLMKTPTSIIKVDAAPSSPVVKELAGRMGMRVLTGYMGLDLPDAHAAGCAGCMPTVSLVHAFANLWSLLTTDPERGRALHQRLLPLLQYVMQSVEFLISCEKHLLRAKALIRFSNTRRPAYRLTAEDLCELNRLARDLNDLLQPQP